ncbi:MAG: tryptophan-rich sensory protein [Lachnospiraceae bacterium]|nr:tryptophan-rich sensory protein [Candidatus Merdinaster equi]
MKKVRVGTLIIALLIPLLVGGVSAAISMPGMAMYETMNKPPLSPPAWLFSVAWTILYLIMGFASYIILVSDADMKTKTKAMILYGIQLLMNFMWSIVFFVWRMYLIAFIWLMIMWCLVIFCTIRFFFIRRPAAYLLVPYVLWLTFAAYLNLGSYIVNLL